MAATAPGCHLSNLMLPKNDANTCWWLSANLALFHKVRPGLDDILTGAQAESNTDEKTKVFYRNLSSNFLQLYNYYSGSSNSTLKAPDSMTQLIELRLGTDMKTVFDSGTFSVAGSNTQSSDEYIATLSKYIGFDNGLVSINKGSETGAFETSAYDLYLHASHFGMPRANSDTNIPFYSQLRSDVNTIILTFGRNDTKGKTSIPILPLHEITIPTFNLAKLRSQSNYEAEYIVDNSNLNIGNPHMQQFPYKLSNIVEFTDTTSFYLDAMVVYETEHYVSYVKCEGSPVWYYYKAIQEGTLGGSNAGNKSFSNFEHLMSNRGKEISSNFTHLFYSKMEVDAEEGEGAAAEEGAEATGGAGEEGEATGGAEEGEAAAGGPEEGAEAGAAGGPEEGAAAEGEAKKETKP